MSAGRYDIAADQRATFTLVLTWQDSGGNPLNLTGYAAKMQVRDATSALIIELSTVNGRITLGGTAGTITLAIAAADMAALPSPAPAGWVYDLLLTDAGGDVTRLVAGGFTVTPGVTQP